MIRSVGVISPELKQDSKGRPLTRVLPLLSFDCYFGIVKLSQQAVRRIEWIGRNLTSHKFHAGFL